MRDVYLHGQPLSFPADSFVAAGGEATVYALGEVAYKVFHGPVDGGRLRALAALKVHGALLPRDLLIDGHGIVVGHTMELVAGATPLSRLLSRRFCRDHGYDPSVRLRIAGDLANLVRAIHSAGALVVDLHEGNVLINASGAPVLVDTSSWQLPGFGATALQDAVRDRHATGFDEGTDWFAFAVTVAQLLLGVHPYRGVHPTLITLDERMRARVSVFASDVRLPPVCPSPNVVPSPWRDWLQDVLDGPHRGPPPKGRSLARWHPTSTPTGTTVSLSELAQAPFPMADALELAGRRVLTGPAGLVVDDQVHGPWDAVTITDDGHVLAARIDQQRLSMTDLTDGRPLPTSLLADEVARLGNGFVVRSGGRLVQLEVRHGIPVPRLLASLLPHASRLHDGMAVHDVAGACHLLLLSPGRCDTRRVPELDGWVVQHAQHTRGVVALVARRGGRTDRFILRTAPGRVELRRTENVVHADVDLVALPSHRDGVALKVGGRLELFRRHPGHPDLRSVEDPSLASGRLVALEGALGLLSDQRLFRLRPRS